METPLVSIFMPVYNGQKYLSATIDNVLLQTYKNFELVCVDDSSTDNSYDIIEDYARQDNRIVVYRKKNGGNVPKSFNFVIDKLRGDFYLYMSQDDKISEDFLEKAMNAYNDTGCDIIVPICKLVGKKEEEGIELSLRPNSIMKGKDGFLLALDWRIHGFNLVKMDLLKGERCDETIYNSDEFLTRRYFFKAKFITSCNGCYYYYRGNTNSITSATNVYRLQALLNDKAISDYIEEHRNELPSKVDLIWNSMLAKQFYWGLHFIRDNKHLWSNSDYQYAASIYNRCKGYLKLGQLLSLLVYPKTFVKMCIAYAASF